MRGRIPRRTCWVFTPLTRIHITPQISLDLGLRFDRYTTSSSSRSAHIVPPHRHRMEPQAGAGVPAERRQTFYLTYTTSFDPAVSYLTIAPDTKGPPPQTATTYEVGAKMRLLGGMLGTTAACSAPIRPISRWPIPDDPTLQELPGTNQRCRAWSSPPPAMSPTRSRSTPTTPSSIRKSPLRPLPAKWARDTRRGAQYRQFVGGV